MKVVRLVAADVPRLGLMVLVGALGGIAGTGVFFAVARLVAEGTTPSIWLLVSLSLVAIAGRSLARELIERAAWDGIFKLRVQLARQMLAVPLSRLESVGSSRLLTAMTDDVSRVAGAFPHLAMFCVNTAFILGCFVYLAWLSVAQFLITASIIVAGLVVQDFIHRAGIDQFRISRRTWDQMIRSFRGLIDGAKELKLNTLKRRRALDAFSGEAAAVRLSARKHNMLFGAAATSMQVAFFAALGAAVLGTELVGTDRQTVARYVLAIVWMAWPLQGIIAERQAMQEADVALGRLEELGLHLNSLVEAGVEATSRAGGLAGELRVTGLRFEYRGVDRTEGFSFGPLDCTFRSGEITFIVGGNGSGKTTFAKVISGLYPPSGGRITIDGCEVTEDNRDAYRQNFTAVFHDFHLFDFVAAPAGGLGGKAISELLARLQMDRRIRIDGDKVSSTTALSTGERKRLALLCAVLDDRPICVFDEWAAEQDPAFREFFYRQFLPGLKKQGKLVFVISHDDRYFGVADQMVTLERGEPPVLSAPAVRLVAQ